MKRTFWEIDMCIGLRTPFAEAKGLKLSMCVARYDRIRNFGHPYVAFLIQ